VSPCMDENRRHIFRRGLLRQAIKGGEENECVETPNGWDKKSDGMD